jgi:hypothetical protein
VRALADESKEVYIVVVDDAAIADGGERKDGDAPFASIFALAVDEGASEKKMARKGRARPLGSLAACFERGERLAPPAAEDPPDS